MVDSPPSGVSSLAEEESLGSVSPSRDSSPSLSESPYRDESPSRGESHSLDNPQSLDNSPSRCSTREDSLPYDPPVREGSAPPLESNLSSSPTAPQQSSSSLRETTPPLSSARGIDSPPPSPGIILDLFFLLFLILNNPDFYFRLQILFKCQNKNITSARFIFV